MDNQQNPQTQNQPQEQFIANDIPQQPPIYTQPPAPVMSIKSWLLTFLVLAIPCVNIIMLFVWAFSKTEDPTRANFCKAQLIWIAIIIGVSIVLSIIFAVAGLSLASSLIRFGYSAY